MNHQDTATITAYAARLWPRGDWNEDFSALFAQQVSKLRDYGQARAAISNCRSESSRLTPDIKSIVSEYWRLERLNRPAQQHQPTIVDQWRRQLNIGPEVPAADVVMTYWREVRAKCVELLGSDANFRAVWLPQVRGSLVSAGCSIEEADWRVGEFTNAEPAQV